MLINVGKTKSMLVHPPPHPTHQMNLLINNNNIENVNNFRYLGVIIDDKLTWNDHFESVCENMNARTYLINRHKSSVSQKWLHIITTGITLSVFIYLFIYFTSKLLN
jgi:hypothetical protein